MSASAEVPATFARNSSSKPSQMLAEIKRKLTPATTTAVVPTPMRPRSTRLSPATAVPLERSSVASVRRTWPSGSVKSARLSAEMATSAATTRLAAAPIQKIRAKRTPLTPGRSPSSSRPRSW